LLHREDRHLEHTFADLAKALNRSTVYLCGLPLRFELPTFEGESYSSAYLAFIPMVVHLRTLPITAETLRDLWHIEKQLFVPCDADSTGSPTCPLYRGKISRKPCLSL
jgi:hypothetical protein